jgi:hypothetical protein
MNTTDPENHDAALRGLLKEWRVETPLPPRFQGEVWRRIERAQGQTVPSIWAVIAHWLGTALARPAAAAAYIAVLLVVGGSVGWTEAQEKTARVKEELGQRYIRVLDPNQTPLYSWLPARPSVGHRLVRRPHTSRTTVSLRYGA